MRKVMFFITGLGTGGAERFLTRLLPRLNDVDFILVSLLGIKDQEKVLLENGVRVYYLNSGKKFNLFKSINNFRKIVKEFKPDLLFTFLLHADIFGRVFGKLFGIKKIYCSIRNNNSKFKVLNFFDRMSSFLVALYIPNSLALVKFLVDENRINLKKIKVIPNGVDLDEIELKLDKNYSLRDELGIEKYSFLITCVARLTSQKNHITLIRAFKKFYEKSGKGYLVLVGDGDLIEELRMNVLNLDIKDRVFFLGNRTDVLNIINCSNVFVLPSITEGMSNALLEAMALGKICIVSDIKQNTVLIEKGRNGLTFKVGNETDLFEKINRVYSDFQGCSKLGKKAYKDIKEKYNMDKIVNSYQELLK